MGDPIETVKIPWDEGVQLIAERAGRAAAKEVLDQHSMNCVGPKEAKEALLIVRDLKDQRSYGKGFVAGMLFVAGAIGGVVSAIIGRIVG